MKYYTQHSWVLKSDDSIQVNDQSHMSAASLCNFDFHDKGASWSIVILPAHIPQLLEVVRVLMQYATPEQVAAAIGAMQEMIAGYALKEGEAKENMMTVEELR